MTFASADHDRRFHSMLRIGTVVEVSGDRAMAKVSLGGEAVSTWLPWITRAGTISTWSPVAVNEQVLVGSVSGDTAQGIILGSLFSSNNSPASVDLGERRIELGNAAFSMESDRIVLSVGSTSITIVDGEITLDSPGKITSKGGASTVTIDSGAVGLDSAKVTSTGTIEGDNDVVASGISLVTHVHGGIISGAGKTKEPE